MPEAPNNRFWPATVMTASKHLAVPICGPRMTAAASGRAQRQALRGTRDFPAE
jgi:hypothetical protein